MVYPNGETRDFAVGCLGTKLEEIMNDAKIKLNLVQPVQTLFDENGAIVTKRKSKDVFFSLQL